MKRVWKHAFVLSLVAVFPVHAALNEYEQAVKLIESKEFGRAESLLRTWTERHPDDREALFRLAQVLAWQGNFDSVLALYRRLLSVDPDNSDYLLGQGQVLLWKGEAERALPALERARILTPGYHEVWRQNLKALIALGRLHEARELRRRAVSRFPDEAFEDVPAKATGVKSEPPRRHTEVELGAGFDGLSAGFDDWRHVYVNASHSLDQRTSVYGGLRETERFSRNDLDLQAGAVLPFGESWTGTLEFGGSPTHHVLPAWTATGQLHHRIGGGFGAALAYRQSSYTDTDSHIGLVALEKYWGDFRLAYTLFVSALDEGSEVYSHLGQISYYYGQDSRVSLAYGNGQEAIRVGPGDIRNADVQSVMVFGQHRLTPRWALSYELGWWEQGALYHRIGFNLGLRYLF